MLPALMDASTSRELRRYARSYILIVNPRGSAIRVLLLNGHWPHAE